MFSLCLCGLTPDTLASSYSPKTCKPGVSRLIGHSELLVGVNVSVDGCFSLYVSPSMNRILVQSVRRPGLKMLR